MTVSPIRAAFDRANAEGRAAFVAYLMAGYPDMATSIELALAVAEAGADAIELGVPFSDPLADGAVIQHAAQGALASGMTLEKCFDVARAVRAKSDVPLILMGYYNPFLRMGLARAFAEAAVAGVNGVIVPDLPPEEAGDLTTATRAADLRPVFLVTPTSSPARVALVARAARDADSPFIYVVSLSGVTGARTDVAATLPDLLQRVRSHTGDTPLGVGFGISRPEHAAAVAQIADGIIVGSALINAFDHADPGTGVAAVASLARELRAGAHHSSVPSSDAH
jgi:tryptophan synthase alpha chain